VKCDNATEDCGYCNHREGHYARSECQKETCFYKKIDAQCMPCELSHLHEVKSDIWNHTGNLYMSMELLEDMIELQYAMWVKALHAMNLVIYEMKHDYDKGTVTINCMSPFFLEDKTFQTRYKFQVTQECVDRDKPEFKYGIKFLTLDDKVIYEIR
jgi:hypothetical protein